RFVIFGQCACAYKGAQVVRLLAGPPKVTFSPSHVQPGDTLDLPFDNATPDLTVAIGGIAIPPEDISVVSPSEVQVVVPAEAVAPVVAHFAPVAAVANGAVTITGTGLAGATADFNGVPATVKSSSATRLVVLVPPTATTGQINVSAAGLVAPTATAFKPIPKI